MKYEKGWQKNRLFQKDISSFWGLPCQKRQRTSYAEANQSCLGNYNSLRSKTEFVRFAVNMP